MTLCVVGSHGTVLNQSGPDDDPLTGLFISPSGRFAASLSETLLTVFCLSMTDITVVDSLEVNDLVSAAGDRYIDTEGTFSQVVWGPDESVVFVATRNSLLGVLTLVENPNYKDTLSQSLDEDGVGDEFAILNTGVSPYMMAMDSVLILPIPDYLICGSYTTSGQLLVVPTNSRLLLLVDWRNYRSRARRFILPSIGGSDGCSSPINSLLPQNDDSRSTPPIEDVKVIDAVVSDQAGLLMLLYETGLIRLFALTHAVDRMTTVLPSPSVDRVAVSGDLLAVATTAGAVYCYRLSSNGGSIDSNLIWRWKPPRDERVESISWDSEILVIGTQKEFIFLNIFGKFILSGHSYSGANPRLTLAYHTLVRASKNQVEFLPVWYGGGMKCSGEFSKQILISRDSIRVFSHPTNWTHISVPTLFVSDHGQLGQCAVQINEGSVFVVALPVSGLGFAVWSSWTSSLVSDRRRAGQWALIGEKSGEEKIGRIEFCGFIGETVFVTKSATEILLWSIFRRLDLEQVLHVEQLEGDVDAVAFSSKFGKVGLVVNRSLLVYTLTSETKSYRLKKSEPIVLTQLPDSLVIHSLHWITPELCLVLSKNGELFDPISGNRIAGGISDGIFSANLIGMEDRLILDDGEIMDHTPPVVVDAATHACVICSKISRIENSFFPASECVKTAIHSQQPFVWMEEIEGNVSLWIVLVNGQLEFIGRVFHTPSEGRRVVCIDPRSGQGIMFADDFNCNSFSAIHPVLVLADPSDAWGICRRLLPGGGLGLVVEIWIHSVLTDSMGVISKVKDLANVDEVCGNVIVSEFVRRLLNAVWVGSHFPSIFAAAYAAAIRKTEPQITFPLAANGQLCSVSCEELFHENPPSVSALLLLILQEKYGPETVRSKFALPLFSECMQTQNFTLARDIAKFILSSPLWDGWGPTGTAIDVVIREVLEKGDKTRRKKMTAVLRIDESKWLDS